MAFPWLFRFYQKSSKIEFWGHFLVKKPVQKRQKTEKSAKTVCMVDPTGLGKEISTFSKMVPTFLRTFFRPFFDLFFERVF